MDGQRLDWNHPRCWSDPSRYRSAGGSEPLSSKTAKFETPESNQTSKISFPFLKVEDPHLPHLVPGGMRDSAGSLYQISIPFCLTRFVKNFTDSASRCVSLHSSQTKAGMGT